jgi:cysteinyl-tRNA synthetase
MDEEGRKMSKSLGNTVVPQDVIKQSGADILRLWVLTTDYWEDQRLGKEILRPTSTPIASCATPSAGCSARSRMTTARRWPLARCRSWSG